MHANKREELPRAGAGDIIAVAGLKQTTTGDTLSDPQKPIVLESMTFPAPVIDVAIEPKTKSDQEKLGIAIQKLAEEDPTFQVHNDEETGQTIISGMGELHLEILVDRMRREFKVEANVGKPQVAYRETIRRIVEREDFTHKKQTGGSGQYAKVQIKLEPLEMTPDGPTYEFVNAVTGGRIPKEFIPSVDAGAQEAMQYGILAGYPLVGVKCHPARRWLPRGRLVRDGVQDRRFDGASRPRPARPSPVLLEPMMAVEVTTPEENMGDVIGDLNSRRGQIQAMEERGGAAGRSRPSCRCRRCSATSATCGPRRRAGRATRCSSTATPRCRRTWPRRSSRRRPASKRDDRRVSSPEFPVPSPTSRT